MTRRLNVLVPPKEKRKRIENCDHWECDIVGKDFSWEAITHDPKSFKFKLNFEKPKDVSYGDPDYIEILINQPEFFRSSSSDLVAINIESQDAGFKMVNENYPLRFVAS